MICRPDGAGENEVTAKENDRDKTYQAQTTEQYAALGQFIQEFGQICNWLQIQFVLLLQEQGLGDQTIANIIIGNKAITAEPLVQIMEGLAGHLISNDKVGMEILGHVTKRFRALITTRNDFVHGTWSIGWANPGDTDFSVIGGMKPAPNKKGMAYKELPKSVEEIHALVEEAKQVNKLFMRFFICVCPKRLDFSKNFTKTTEGEWLPEPPANTT